ncbi:MAG TPA: ATP-binding protein [Roseiflexaceae bacterium]|nr:ATP-binding protein [Roseiflexaceae bacterium]
MDGDGQILRIAAELRALETVRHFLERVARDLGVPPDPLYDVLLSVDELVTNIVLHGYRGGPGTIEVQVRPVGDALEITLRDEAPVFDPTRVPAPDTTLPLELRPSGGLGIHLARHFTDSIAHRALPGGGNEIILVKKGVIRPSAKGEPHGPDG